MGSLPLVERLFSEQEANELLPQLRELLQRLRQATDALSSGAAGAATRVASNGSAAAAAAGSAEERAFTEVMGEIEALGVIVRDPESGLVDFASTREGEPIYLCWRLEEDRVAFWHPRDTGYGGREPL